MCFFSRFGFCLNFFDEYFQKRKIILDYCIKKIENLNIFYLYQIPEFVNWNIWTPIIFFKLLWIFLRKICLIYMFNFFCIFLSFLLSSTTLIVIVKWQRRWFRTWFPSYVQLPNFMSQCWSSNGNQVMSILHVLLKMPGGTYRQLPLCLTTTLVWYVPSNPSSALYFFINKYRIFTNLLLCYCFFFCQN